MGENSKLEWTDHTFNPWRGCTKVSAGCANCYAESTSKRNPGTLGIWGEHGTRVIASEAMWREPIKWNRRCETDSFIECVGCGRRSFFGDDLLDSFCPECGDPEGRSVRPRVFVASLADVFEDWSGIVSDSRGLLGHVFDDGDTFGFGPRMVGQKFGNPTNVRPLTLDDLRRRMLQLFAATPNLDKLVLTKRPENFIPMIDRIVGLDWWQEHCAAHVWLGTSVENQEAADQRIPELLKCRDLASVLFLSCEPLLGPVTFRWAKWCPFSSTGVTDELDGLRMLSWVIAGGESGAGARPMHPDWARSIRDQCASAGAPFFFKQWGEWGLPSQCEPRVSYATHEWGNQFGPPVRSMRVGKKAAGRRLDGVTHDEFPSCRRASNV